MDEFSLLRSFFFTRMKRHPNAEAVYDYQTGMRYSYVQLQQRAWRLSRFLKRKGLAKGDRMGIFSRNDMVYIDAYYAFPYTGIIITSYNVHISSSELAFLLTREKPRILFYDPDFEDRTVEIQKILPDCILVKLSSQDTSGRDSYGDVMSAPLPDEPTLLKIGMEDTLQLLHTGGTTGLPKAAKIPCRQIYFNAVGQQNAWDLRSTDSTIAYLPMFHTGTWNTLVTPMLYSGGRVILLRRFDPDTVLDMIQTEHVSILWGVPTVYRRLMEHSRFETADFKSIRCCRCGAAPPALDMMEKYWEKGIYFCNGYGMTETSPGNLSMPAATLSITQLTQKRTSCGMLMPYNEARIVDDQDRSLPPGKKGELLFRGNLLFSGYWEDPEETEKAIRNGWFHTGDMAMKDEDGFYYIVGRKKNMYITSGENIFPQDVEAALFRNPNVMDVAVLGMPDKICGEVGKAVVVIRPGEVLTEEELRLFAQKELPAIQRPVYYTFVKALPRTAVGKLDMKELKRLYGSISGFQDGWNS